MTQWLVTGASGMLGRDLTAILSRRGESVTGLRHADLDLTDQDAVSAAIDRLEPDVVVNCAAWTAVDDAEGSEDKVLAVNGHGPAALASACGQTRCKLVQISTDYVFDGTGAQPYPEDGPVSPQTAYGRSKLAGERAVIQQLPESGYVVRTAWLYGEFGQNFVRTMIRLERTRPYVEVVSDQRGQPTWTVDVAGRILALIQSDASPGIYHATSAGDTTWFGLAQEVFRQLGADAARVRPTTTDAFPRPARRPAYSVLGHDAWTRAGLDSIGGWRQALQKAFPLLASAEAQA